MIPTPPKWIEKPRKPKPVIKELNGPVLTVKQRDPIRADLESDMSNAAVARKYGISRERCRQLRATKPNQP